MTMVIIEGTFFVLRKKVMSKNLEGNACFYTYFLICSAFLSMKRDHFY